MIKVLLTLSVSCFLLVFYLKSNSASFNEPTSFKDSEIETDYRVPNSKQDLEGSRKGYDLNKLEAKRGRKHLDSQRPVLVNKTKPNQTLRSAQVRPDEFDENDSREALEDIIDLSAQNITKENEERVYENLSIYLKRYDKSLDADNIAYLIKIVGKLVEYDPSDAPEELLYFQLQNLSDEEKEQSFKNSGLSDMQIARLQDRLISYGYILENGNG